MALGTVQSDGMGEGWSDFVALGLLGNATDDPNACYPMGGYVTYQLYGITAELLLWHPPVPLFHGHDEESADIQGH